MTGLEKKREKNVSETTSPKIRKRLKTKNNSKALPEWKLNARKSELKYPECLEVERAWARAQEPKVKHLTKLTEARCFMLVIKLCSIKQDTTLLLTGSHVKLKGLGRTPGSNDKALAKLELKVKARSTSNDFRVM